MFPDRRTRLRPRSRWKIGAARGAAEPTIAELGWIWVLLGRLGNPAEPALKVRLAASRKRDGNEWAWVLNVAPTAAAVWAERTCEVAGDAVQMSEQFSELIFVVVLECQICAALAKVQPAQPLLKPAAPITHNRAQRSSRAFLRSATPDLARALILDSHGCRYRRTEEASLTTHVNLLFRLLLT